MTRRYKTLSSDLGCKMRPGIATVEFLPNKIVAPSHTGNSSTSKMKSEASAVSIIVAFSSLFRGIRAQTLP